MASPSYYSCWDSTPNMFTFGNKMLFPFTAYIILPKLDIILLWVPDDSSLLKVVWEGLSRWAPIIRRYHDLEHRCSSIKGWDIVCRTTLTWVLPPRIISILISSNHSFKVASFTTTNRFQVFSADRDGWYRSIDNSFYTTLLPVSRPEFSWPETPLKPEWRIQQRATPSPASIHSPKTSHFSPPMASHQSPSVSLQSTPIEASFSLNLSATQSSSEPPSSCSSSYSS